MIKVLLFDLSGVLLFPKDESYTGKLNDLYKDVLKKKLSFLDYYKFNEELLLFLESVKTKYMLSIFTTESIQNDPVVQARFGSLFSSVYSAHALGVSKKDPHSYNVIAARLKHDPSEIVFVDDRVENVEAAKTASMNGILYSSPQQVIHELQTI